MNFRPVFHCSMFCFQIKSNDGLPQHVCTECVSELRIAFVYKKKCEESDIKLRDYFREHLHSSHVKLEEVDLQPDELMDSNWLQGAHSLAIADAIPVSNQYSLESDEGDDSHANFDTFTAPSDDDEIVVKAQSSCMGNDGSEEVKLSKCDEFQNRKHSFEVEKSEFGANAETKETIDSTGMFRYEVSLIDDDQKIVQDNAAGKKFTCDICEGKFTRLYNLK